MLENAPLVVYQVKNIFGQFVEPVPIGHVDKVYLENQQRVRLYSCVILYWLDSRYKRHHLMTEQLIYEILEQQKGILI